VTHSNAIEIILPNEIVTERFQFRLNHKGIEDAPVCFEEKKTRSAQKSDSLHSNISFLRSCTFRYFQPLICNKRDERSKSQNNA